MKKIILTGGGTAGHVTPNIALLPSLKKEGFEILYIGSKEYMEKNLIEHEGIPFAGVSTGKFRRYLSLKNLTDPFKVVNGYFEARKIINDFKPDVIFSKGGFVSVPVVLAATTFRKKKVPVIIHESDMTPGLANKISIPYAKKVCCNFPETMKELPAKKAVLSGTPIRAELLNGDAKAGYEFTGLTPGKPVILLMGGSSGSVILNKTIRSMLPDLLPDFNVIHLCGKGNLDKSMNEKGYVQYEYISDQLKDLMAMADLVISRAGANAICELVAMNKPNILIPLSLAVSRGDQIKNAESFERQGFSCVIREEELSRDRLLSSIRVVTEHREDYISKMKASTSANGVETVMKLIKELAG